ncbi:MAG: hypothetical protein NTV52_03950 [Acidobacteria bacterium]|nr:hypothetical protein [Acidobacteriota bacterium]
MPEIEGDHNTTLEVTIVPTLAAYWSRARCWHGEKVKVLVRSAFVPDGTAVELKILDKDTLDEVAVIAGQKIAGSKVDYEYTINWRDTPPPEGAVEFVIAAKTTDPAVTAAHSPSLFVDLTAPVLSF